MAKILNRYSQTITQPKKQGASQAMLYGIGLSEAEMSYPQVGVASVWYEGNTCNRHLNDLGLIVKNSMAPHKIVGLRFNTIGVSDGMSMGTDGMSYSLQSREVIADSIETIMGAQWYDGLVALPGCDKNMPGCLMALGRLNRPGFMIYGGTIQPGSHNGKDIDIISAFQSYGEFLAKNISDDERKEIIKKACPGSGACGGMYTANTMACAIEAMGMTLPYSSSTPAIDPLKTRECETAGRVMLNLLEKDIKPRDIMTRDAFHNAMVVTIAMGGSTNAVLHLIAMAKSVEVPFTIEDVQKISDQTPMLADFKPSGKYVMADLHRIGGTPAVLKFLLKEKFLRGDCLTITGKTMAENLKSLPELTAGQKIVQPVSAPLKKTGHLQILKGKLAPEGSVAKITGKEGEYFKGPANCFDSEEDMLAAFEKGLIKKGQVLIIRYEGPKGGPGMPEMLSPTSVIMGAGMGKDVALLTDGRFSGGSHGFIIGHISPEAQEGGPLALVQNGDIVTIDVPKRIIDVDVSDQEMEKRRQAWVRPPYKVRRGTLYKYIKNVTSASEGCVTDE
jgi:dihydroxy-acid dehydratase